MREGGYGRNGRVRRHLLNTLTHKHTTMESTTYGRKWRIKATHTSTTILYIEKKIYTLNKKESFLSSCCTHRKRRIKIKRLLRHCSDWNRQMRKWGLAKKRTHTHTHRTQRRTVGHTELRRILNWNKQTEEEKTNVNWKMCNLFTLEQEDDNKKR